MAQVIERRNSTGKTDAAASKNGELQIGNRFVVPCVLTDMAYSDPDKLKKERSIAFLTPPQLLILAYNAGTPELRDWLIERFATASRNPDSPDYLLQYLAIYSKDQQVQSDAITNIKNPQFCIAIALSKICELAIRRAALMRLEQNKEALDELMARLGGSCEESRVIGAEAASALKRLEKMPNNSF